MNASLGDVGTSARAEQVAVFVVKQREVILAVIKGVVPFI